MMSRLFQSKTTSASNAAGDELSRRAQQALEANDRAKRSLENVVRELLSERDGNRRPHSA